MTDKQPSRIRRWYPVFVAIGAALLATYAGTTNTAANGIFYGFAASFIFIGAMVAYGISGDSSV